jgi:hypothetical protein
MTNARRRLGLRELCLERGELRRQRLQPRKQRILEGELQQRPRTFDAPVKLLEIAPHRLEQRAMQMAQRRRQIDEIGRGGIHRALRNVRLIRIDPANG